MTQEELRQKLTKWAVFWGGYNARKATDMLRELDAILAEKEEVVEFEGFVSDDSFWDGITVSIDVGNDAWRLPKNGQKVLIRAPRQQKPEDWEEQLTAFGISKQEGS